MPIALILGASSDMAVAIARSLAGNGYDIILAARRVDRLAPLQSDLSIRYGVKASLAEFDAANPPSHAGFYRSLPAKPDLAICVFGFMGDQQEVEHNWPLTEKTILINYTGAVSILNIIAEDFENRKQGVIVGISSVAGLRGRQKNYIYGSAKAGFIAYLSGLRNRLYPAGVHVVTVLPGFIRTRMNADLNLPPLITGQPADVGAALWTAVKKKKNVIYIKWYWRWIMVFIRLIPEARFKKMKL